MISFTIVTDGRAERHSIIDMNIAEILQQCLSLDVPFEIIIVGNPYRTYYKEFISVFDINATANSRVGALMNRAAMNCKYDICVIMHDDVIIAEDFVEQLIKFDNVYELDEWCVIAPSYILPPPDFRGLNTKQCYQHPLWTIGGPQGHKQLNSNEEIDEFSYVSGEIIIARSYVFGNCRWNNDNIHKLTRGSEHSFDVEFGRTLYQENISITHVPEIKIYALET